MAPASPPEKGNAPLDQLTLLYALAEGVQRTRNVDLVFQDAVDGLCRVLGVEGAALLVLDGGLMRMRASSGISDRCQTGLEGYAPWPASLRDPRPMLLADVTDAPEAAPVRDALVRAGVRSMACVPLLHRGRLFGELLLLRAQPGPVAPASVRLAEAVAGHLALALWRSRTDADQAELLRRFEAERSVLESVVKQMPAGVLLADAPSGRIVMANAQVEAIWGRSLRHAGRVADYALWAGRDAAGHPLEAEDWPLARSVMSGETVRAEEITIERTDGSEATIRMSSGPVVDSQGRQLAAVATIYDVTQERQAEEQHALIEEATRRLNTSLELKQTTSALTDLVVGRFADWCVVYHRADPDFVERTAAVHSDPEMASLVEPFGAGSFPLSSDHPVARVIRDKAPLLTAEAPGDMIRAALGDDSERLAAIWRLGAASVLMLPLVIRDRALGALTLVRSERRFEEGEIELLTELAQRAAVAMDNALLYEKARAADRAKANFLAVMSHEFRTPLSAILGYADILTAEVHGGLNTKQQRHVDRVKASVRHLSHLVDEILSFASMEAGRERVRPERVELVALTHDVIGIMEPIAEAAGLELRVRLPDRLELVTDPQKLRQILINLLSNAIKYTPTGSVDLTLETARDVATCSVSDTGPGIAPEHWETVFEPFWQVDRGDGRRITGTGLGLAVARRLARLLGGDVTLLSKVGEGSTFTLELPVQPVAVMPQDSGTAAPPLAQPEASETVARPPRA